MRREFRERQSAGTDQFHQILWHAYTCCLEVAIKAIIRRSLKRSILHIPAQIWLDVPLRFKGLVVVAIPLAFLLLSTLLQVAFHIRDRWHGRRCCAADPAVSLHAGTSTSR